MKVRAIGTCEIEIRGTKITPASETMFALALFLGCRAGDRLRRSELLAMFWPGLPEQPARHALRQLLYRLRKVGLQLDAEGEYLLLDPSTVESDLNRILASSWPETTAIGDAEAAGSVLPGYDAPISEPFREWLDAMRSVAGKQQRRALLRQINIARREARWPEVERLARRCLETDPLNEEATLAVAESLAMEGGKASAVRILDEYLDELGAAATNIGLPARVLRRRVSDRTFDPDGQSALDRIFVGREAELARILRSLDEAEKMVGGSIHLLGDAGMGKTRFAAEVRREATLRGFATINVRLHATDKVRPLAVVVDAVRALLGLPGALGCSTQTMSTLRLLTERRTDSTADAHASTEAEVKQYQVREALLDLLGAIADEGPLLIIVDDMQHVDTASMSLLQDLISWCSDKRVLWLLTSRNAETLSSRPYAVAASSHSTLRLDALSRTACSRLIELALPRSHPDEQADLGQATWNLAGGHPFFVRELVTAWITSGRSSALPTSVSSAVADRISTLGQGALSILQGCAVLGSFATISRLSRLLSLDPREEILSLNELDSLGIIGASANEPAITLHDIWRDEILRTIRPSTQRLLHLRAAELLEHEAGSARPVGLIWEIARHLSVAGEPKRARMLLEQCAAYLMDIGLPGDAAATFERAAEYCENAAEKLKCICDRLSALKSAGRLDQVRAEISGARSLAISVNPAHDVHDDLEVTEASVLWNTERSVCDVLAQTTRCAEDSGLSVRHRMQMNVLRAIIADNICDDDALRAAFATACRISSTTSEFEAEMLAVDLIYHTTIGDPVSAAESARRFVSFHRSRSVAGSLCRALRYATYAHRIVGAVNEARVHLREAIDIATRYRLAWEAASASDIMATISLDCGDLEDGTRWIKLLEYWTPQTDVRSFKTSLAVARTRLLLASHQPEAAIAVLGDVDYQPLSDPMPRQALTWLCAWCTAYTQLGSTAQVESILSDLRVRLDKMLHRGRQDEFVRSYLGALGALSRTGERADFARHYAAVRRDTTPLPADLREFTIAN